MSELKALHKDAIPAALEKAERYRLLNEPGEAESICLDILAVDPENQQAIITLLLALTDRFEKGYGVSDMQTKELLARIKSEYDQAYYSGIVAERRAKMKMRQNTPDCRFQAYDLFREAMSCFEKAESIRPPGHDDAILRWNTCMRIIERNHLVPREPEERIELPLE
jgi:tetratricopeptide (TPR) repeat protein